MTNECERCDAKGEMKAYFTGHKPMQFEMLCPECIKEFEAKLAAMREGQPQPAGIG